MSKQTPFSVPSNLFSFRSCRFRGPKKQTVQLAEFRIILLFLRFAAAFFWLVTIRLRIRFDGNTYLCWQVGRRFCRPKETNKWLICSRSDPRVRVEWSLQCLKVRSFHILDPESPTRLSFNFILPFSKSSFSISYRSRWLKQMFSWQPWTFNNFERHIVGRC